MTGRDENRTNAAMPDRQASTAAAALALRHLLHFHRQCPKVRLHDDTGIIAWTRNVPAADECTASYQMLTTGLVAADDIDGDVAEAPILALVEAIVSDQAAGRPAVNADDLPTAAALLRKICNRANDRVLGAMTMDALRDHLGLDDAEEGDAPRMPGKLDGATAAPAVSTTAATSGVETGTPAQRSPQGISGETGSPTSLLRLIERWHDLSDKIDTVPPFVDGKPFDPVLVLNAGEWCSERRAIEQRIVETRSRGDADLLAKAEMLRRFIDDGIDDWLVTRVRPLVLSVLDDIENIVGGEP